jgi:hypothetical protein
MVGEGVKIQHGGRDQRDLRAVSVGHGFPFRFGC